jgi:hypothetical protein
MISEISFYGSIIIFIATYILIIWEKGHRMVVAIVGRRGKIIQTPFKEDWIEWFGYPLYNLEHASFSI